MFSLKPIFPITFALLAVAGCSQAPTISAEDQLSLKQQLTPLVDQLEALPPEGRVSFVMQHPDMRGINNTGDKRLIDRYRNAMKVARPAPNGDGALPTGE